MLRLLCAGSLVLTCLGCGGPPTVDTVTVKGKLLQGGQPLRGQENSSDGSPYTAYQGYSLEFYADTVLEGSAQVDAEGGFQLELPSGNYKVVIHKVNRPAGPAGAPFQREPSLKKFATINDTPIVVEVGNEDPTEVTIDLAKY